MLTLEEYKIKYPNAKYLSGSFNDYNGAVILKEGFLEFTKDTAYNFSGPFQDNLARFVLLDDSNKIYTSDKNKGKLILGHSIGFDYNTTIEKPIRLWLLGTDDTSYSKFYSNKEETLFELALFIENEPLKFKEVINDFDFVFTN